MAPPPGQPSAAGLDPATRDFFRRTMTILAEGDVEFLVGGAYAFARYAGIERHTKDFDIFLRESDLDRALELFAKTGCATERTHPHWLAKARSGDNFIDLIYGSGNGVYRVDDDWFAHAVPDRVLDLPVRLMPLEAMIWSKSFIMERERFDGADVAHLLRANAARLDWRRLLDRFGANWRVLLAHLVLFGFIYPGHREDVPTWVLEELIGRLRAEIGQPVPNPKLCRGTLLSRAQYLPDIGAWGYIDARQASAGGTMSAEEIAAWTAGIAVDGDSADQPTAVHAPGEPDKGQAAATGQRPAPD